MKAPTPPVLALAPFPQARTPYYAEQLRAHVARFPHVNAPHGHSFYLLLYVSQGHGTHTVDLVTYDLGPGSVFFLAPGQVHQWHLGPEAEGIVVFFEPDFYQFRYPERDLLALPFFDSTHPPVLYLPATNELAPLFAQLLREYQMNHPNQAEVLRAYLGLILELATRHYPAAPASTGAGLAQSQIRQFGALLNQHYRTHRSVRDYAARLHLTANYLNALCRRVLGQTASDLIHARVVLEARRLLTHSALSVAQVADELGFDDPSYFGRYFRKYVGQSPEAFRQSSNLS
ncbi:AraC family transcriptional regulator [Hymenobacter bucti]|uniref:AraC family transcriptional regulator n=1 Tax=Hymenobacter bucti TaxID=1844114 RepID=A0ABW4QQG7_9BACT